MIELLAGFYGGNVKKQGCNQDKLINHYMNDFFSKEYVDNWKLLNRFRNHVAHRFRPSAITKLGKKQIAWRFDQSYNPKHLQIEPRDGQPIIGLDKMIGYPQVALPWQCTPDSTFTISVA
ncbi:MAG TPA: hypothetical protein VF982_12365, partial [Anaerolineales bacterium]